MSCSVLKFKTIFIFPNANILNDTLDLKSLFKSKQSADWSVETVCWQTNYSKIQSYEM